MTSRNINESQPPRSEIDLLDLFKYMGRALINLASGLLKVIVFIIAFAFKNILWIILSIMVGVGLGYLVYSTSSRYYSSEMVVQPNGFTSIDMANYINDIHELTLKRNVAGIMNAFQIGEEYAEKIKNIEAYFYIDVNNDEIGDYVDENSSFNPSDTTKKIVQDRLLIRAEVFDNTVFQEVKAGLNHYIVINPFLITVNELRKTELINMMQQTDYEIHKLDSLQDFEYFTDRIGDDGTFREKQFVLMNETPTQLYYKDKLVLLNRIQQYQKELELSTDPITVIKDFTGLDVEENPMSDYFIKYGFRFGILGYLGLLVFRYRKKLRKYSNSVLEM